VTGSRSRAIGRRSPHAPRVAPASRRALEHEGAQPRLEAARSRVMRSRSRGRSLPRERTRRELGGDRVTGSGSYEAALEVVEHVPRPPSVATGCSDRTRVTTTARPPRPPNAHSEGEPSRRARDETTACTSIDALRLGSGRARALARSKPVHRAGREDADRGPPPTAEPSRDPLPDPWIRGPVSRRGRP
jgi:hypothetical protein